MSNTDEMDLDIAEDAGKAPPGWHLSKDEHTGEITVIAPDAVPGGITVSDRDRPLAHRVLHALAEDLLEMGPGGVHALGINASLVGAARAAFRALAHLQRHAPRELTSHTLVIEAMAKLSDALTHCDVQGNPSNTRPMDL